MFNIKKKLDMEMLEKVKRLFKKIGPKEKQLTAEEAYYRTKYGVYRTLEQRIKDNQRNIKELIKSKVSPAYKAETKFSSFYCVIDLDDELKPHVNEIFQPFIDNGFNVINLSEKVEEINDELVFLISWYKNDFVKK